MKHQVFIRAMGPALPPPGKTTEILPPALEVELEVEGGVANVGGGDRGYIDVASTVSMDGKATLISRGCLV